MSLNCWKSLGSPQLSQSSTKLKAFDGRTYKPFGIIKVSQVTGSVSFIHALQLALQNIGEGILKDSTLMGTFALSPPVMSAENASIEACYMISSNPYGLRKSTGDSEIVTLDEFVPSNPIELA